MNRLFEIAQELRAIALVNFEAQEGLRQLERSIKARKEQLIPEGGWPGSNDAQRKAAELKAYTTDEPLARFEQEQIELRRETAALEVDRDNLLEEKAAWQWTIRDQQNKAAGGTSAFDLMEQHLDQKDAELKASIEWALQLAPVTYAEQPE
jgi:hypothetical protein